jgi:hypothetical protein
MSAPTAEALAAMVEEYNAIEAEQLARRQAIYEAIGQCEWGSRHIQFANQLIWTWAPPGDDYGAKLVAERMLGPMDLRMVTVLAGSVWSMEEKS